MGKIDQKFWKKVSTPYLQSGRQHKLQANDTHSKARRQ